MCIRDRTSTVITNNGREGERERERDTHTQRHRERDRERDREGITCTCKIIKWKGKDIRAVQVVHDSKITFAFFTPWEGRCIKD